MKDKNPKNIQATKHEDPALPIEEIDVEEDVVNHLRKNPKFKNFTDEQLKAVAETCIIEKTEEYFQSSFSGPLPPPAALNGYEATLPGSADRILTMAEQNAKSRIDLNNRIVEADISRSNKGQILGFILSVIFIGAAILCSYLKQPFPASILGVGGFSSIISIFVLGKQK